MKKKPRKPRILWFDKHYASGISVNTGAGMVVATIKSEVLNLKQRNDFGSGSSKLLIIWK